jgi:hypothetical protein
MNTVRRPYFCGSSDPTADFDGIRLAIQPEREPCTALVNTAKSGLPTGVGSTHCLDSDFKIRLRERSVRNAIA